MNSIWFHSFRMLSAFARVENSSVLYSRLPCVHSVVNAILYCYQQWNMTSALHPNDERHSHDSFSDALLLLFWFAHSYRAYAFPSRFSNNAKMLICAQNVDADARCACVIHSIAIATYVRWPKFIIFLWMTRDRLVYGENADAFVNNRRRKTNKMEIRFVRIYYYDRRWRKNWRKIK